MYVDFFYYHLLCYWIYRKKIKYKYIMKLKLISQILMEQIEKLNVITQREYLYW